MKFWDVSGSLQKSLQILAGTKRRIAKSGQSNEEMNSMVSI